MTDLSQYDIPHSLLNHDEPLVIVVNVHLHLEAFLIALIRAKLPRPDALDIDRLNFPSKLGLAVALDLVPEVAAPALRTINELRNKIAHNLNSVLREEDAEKLRKQLFFTASAAEMPKWSVMGAPQQVALCAMVLQAWMNGVVEGKALAKSNPARDMPSLMSRAIERYPDRVEKSAPNA